MRSVRYPYIVDTGITIIIMILIGRARVQYNRGNRMRPGAGPAYVVGYHLVVTAAGWF